jgi:hypothetical protein
MPTPIFGRARNKEALFFNFIMDSYKAVALINLNQTNEAAEMIQHGLEADSTDRGGLYNSARAILCARQGDALGMATSITNALVQRKGFGHFHHALYNIASACALLDKRDDAVRFLKQAADDGFRCYKFFLLDKNLDNLRHNFKEFDDFLDSQKKLHDVYEAKFGEPASAQ